VDDAAIAGEHATLGNGNSLAEGGDAVLNIHRRLPGLVLARSDISIRNATLRGKVILMFMCFATPPG
jgi:hypothetical protein